jgi:Zn-dependent peptidase ImmA (M78 family)
MSGPLALIEPALLVWARNAAGLPLEQAAAKAGVKVEKLVAWETGSERPTVVQLRKLGGIYKRPLAVFFLPAPPKGWGTMRDFRKLPDAEARAQSPELRLAIREAWERRSVAIELAADLEREPSSFALPASTSDDPETVAAKIRGLLGVSVEEQRSWKNPDTALARWRARVEARGILVFSFSRVDVKEVRGFSISEAPMPVVAVNSKDMPAGRAFSLIHELAHVAIRSGAVMCDPNRDGADVEVFCNHVAGAVLVPRGSLLAEAEVRAATALTVWQDDAVTRFARSYSVSREVLLRRLVVLGKTSRTGYASKRAQFAAEYSRWAQKLKASEGGPDYLTTVLSQNGRFYTRLVLDAFGHQTITASDVATYLGIKTRHIRGLETDVSMRAG